MREGVRAGGEGGSEREAWTLEVQSWPGGGVGAGAFTST